MIDLVLLTIMAVALFAFDRQRQRHLRQMKAAYENVLAKQGTLLDARDRLIVALENKSAAQDNVIAALEHGTKIRDEVIAANEGTIASQGKAIDVLKARAGVEDWEPPRAAETKLN